LNKTSGKTPEIWGYSAIRLRHGYHELKILSCGAEIKNNKKKHTHICDFAVTKLIRCPK